MHCTLDLLSFFWLTRKILTFNFVLLRTGTLLAIASFDHRSLNVHFSLVLATKLDTMLAAVIAVHYGSGTVFRQFRALFVPAGHLRVPHHIAMTRNTGRQLEMTRQIPLSVVLARRYFSRVITKGIHKTHQEQQKWEIEDLNHSWMKLTCRVHMLEFLQQKGRMHPRGSSTRRWARIPIARHAQNRCKRHRINLRTSYMSLQSAHLYPHHHVPAFSRVAAVAVSATGEMNSGIMADLR